MSPPIEFDGRNQCEVVFAPAFTTWWNGLSDQIHEQLYDTIELLEQAGHRLTETYSKKLHYRSASVTALRELRIPVDGKPYRLAYVFHEQRAVLLVGGCKAGVSQDQFYRDLCKKSETSFRGYKAELAAAKLKGLKK